jgi:hypothetical protein
VEQPETGPPPRRLVDRPLSSKKAYKIRASRIPHRTSLIARVLQSRLQKLVARQNAIYCMAFRLRLVMCPRGKMHRGSWTSALHPSNRVLRPVGQRLVDKSFAYIRCPPNPRMHSEWCWRGSRGGRSRSHRSPMPKVPTAYSVLALSDFCKCGLQNA